MKEKILYMMHVDWDWIKQRPHFIAEKLGKTFDVSVFFSYSRKREGLTVNPTNISRSPIIPLPMKKYKLIKLLNDAIQKVYFTYVLKKEKPSFIWITHPSLYSYLPEELLKKHKVIYDCMDDVLEFNYPENVKADFKEAEEKLLQEADTVFVSSEYLKQKIILRGCNKEKTVLVRNGYKGDIIKPTPDRQTEKNTFRLAYVGTISDWVNFDLILSSLDEIKDIEYHFFGPIDCEVPKHDRIIFRGSVKHDELYDHIKDFDSLIMPFMVNELILSVDPVKLYEYVNFNKNIITVFYEEVRRFDDFVYFYQNSEEFINNIKNLKSENTLKYTEAQREQFLKENTWDQRVKQISNVLKERN
jgi:teichuronic acid biosynthesis glycosyltransferase TuaH